MKFTSLISFVRQVISRGCLTSEYCLPGRVTTTWIVVLTLVFGAFVSPQSLEA